MKIPAPGHPDVPFRFRLARTLYAFLKGWRGEYFFYRMLRKAGLLRRAGRFSYFGRSILVPLQVPETLYVYDFSLFHGLREIQFANEINRSLNEFVLIDCGAYFGQVSMRIHQLCPRLTGTIAVEANPDNCDVLRANLESTGKPFCVMNVGVSDFSGRAALVFPHGQKTPDSAYVKRDDNGPIEIRTLEDIVKDAPFPVPDIALKLDVEGHEQAVVAGAAGLIKSASRICFFIELHPAVLRRNGLTAEALLGSISDIRPTEWYLADKPHISIDPRRPVFEQLGGKQICDVIGRAC